jgi:Fe-S cluster biosynthesis and repair protein YggX
LIEGKKLVEASPEEREKMIKEMAKMMIEHKPNNRKGNATDASDR